MRMTILKQPSAFLPIAMSLGALTTVLTYVALNGPAPQADEGTAAHVWQLLMAGQVPFVVPVYHVGARLPSPKLYRFSSCRSRPR